MCSHAWSPALLHVAACTPPCDLCAPMPGHLHSFIWPVCSHAWSPALLHMACVIPCLVTCTPPYGLCAPMPGHLHSSMWPMCSHAWSPALLHVAACTPPCDLCAPVPGHLHSSIWPVCSHAWSPALLHVAYHLLHASCDMQNESVMDTDRFLVIGSDGGISNQAPVRAPTGLFMGEAGCRV